MIELVIYVSGGHWVCEDHGCEKAMKQVSFRSLPFIDTQNKKGRGGKGRGNKPQPPKEKKPFVPDPQVLQKLEDFR